jgi:geranylgeranyl pyrophosphate synthase
MALERINEELDRVREFMLQRVRSGSFPDDGPLGLETALHFGKMLRARLALRMGPAAGTSPDVYLRAAAAIEMVHAASLLHDDVIDGSLLRRSAPAYWARYGVTGAILLGDLLLCEASEILRETGDTRLTDELMSRTTEMCRAEVEQEMRKRKTVLDWECGLDLCRRKTGSLFAFVGFASGVGHPAVAPALREAGYQAGTAYQLSDDYLDAFGHERESGKTLGRDRERDKPTSMTARGGGGPVVLDKIGALRATAAANLLEWPDLHKAWTEYWREDLEPALDRNLGRLARPVGPPPAR